MFIPHWHNGGIDVDTLDDANSVMADIWATSGDCTINVELLDDDNESLSYWTFNMGDNLIPPGAAP